MANNNTKVLVTGMAGFIGFHTVKKLLTGNFEITGLDILNEYYDPNLKFERLNQLGFSISEAPPENEYIVSKDFPNLSFIKLNLTDSENVKKVFDEKQFDIVIHLAAQAGVRYSIEAPEVYIQSNIVGFFNILENSKSNKVKHLIYASSSSVYGNTEKIPFSESDSVDHPVSLYAATKKSNELMAHSYSSIHKLPVTGLRFFTVYGPWGRPDMATFLFTKNILEEKPIKVFNNGNLYRDFTYVDDIVDGISKVVNKGAPEAGYALYNIGNNTPVSLIDFISVIEKHTGKTAIKEFAAMQNGDVYKTYANIDELQKAVGYHPTTDIDEGIKHFVEWFRNYYKI